ncbi:MAG: hypothetical protein KKI06_05020 [Euryarchaeota archaeon]|nr:hypothetical protein [Euryarchaeota archaeon]
MLKVFLLIDEGRFYLKDTVYSFEVDDYEYFFDTFIEGFRNVAGDEMTVYECMKPDAV